MKPSLRKLLLLVTPLLFAACATVGPPQPPSLELPKPPSDLRALRKGDRVTLTWTIPTLTTDRQRVRSLGSTRICRGLSGPLTQCGAPAGEALPVPLSGVTDSGARKLTTKKSSKPKVEDSYTDLLPPQVESDDGPAVATYAIEVLNADGRGAGLSNQAQVSLVRTLPPPPGFEARVTAQGIVLSWSAAAQAGACMPGLHYLYRVYRRAEGSQQSTLIGELPASNQPGFTLTDSNIEWEKTYEYHAVTVTQIAPDDKPPVDIEGDDSPQIKVFAHDTFPPAVPSSLQAVFSGPGQQPFIDLIWAPVTDVDLAGYNVYRRDGEGTAVKLNAEPLKIPAYRDAAIASGTKYTYSVSAVDVRGNESARSRETGEAVP